jgi:5'-methylthioadenosine phosphorylase
VLGIIGGSGVYAIPGLVSTRWQRVHSPFGEPSDELYFGELDGQPLVFLPRHGRGHRIPPNEVDYRANIDALKRVGVTDILALSAVGSLREDLAPGAFAVVDQFIDRTFARKKTFFGKGMVAHVSMAHPVCNRVGDALFAAAKDAGADVRRGGTYVVMEGPQFSSKAESELYRSWKCDVVGMTAMPEAKLAREAEICYATLAMVTDYDCWHPDHDHVTVDEVVRVMHQNVERARDIIRRIAPVLREHAAPCPHRCDHALDAALMTAKDARDPELFGHLDAILARTLSKEASR